MDFSLFLFNPVLQFVSSFSETMNNFRKYASGVARSGLLGAGLLGMYLTHKERIPEYVGFVSCYISCIGLYALTTYLLEDEYDQSENKDKVY